jgi:hypothetical protein
MFQIPVLGLDVAALGSGTAAVVVESLIQLSTSDLHNF